MAQDLSRRNWVPRSSGSCHRRFTIMLKVWLVSLFPLNAMLGGQWDWFDDHTMPNCSHKLRVFNIPDNVFVLLLKNRALFRHHLRWLACIISSFKRGVRPEQLCQFAYPPLLSLCDPYRLYLNVLELDRSIEWSDHVFFFILKHDQTLVNIKW